MNLNRCLIQIQTSSVKCDKAKYESESSVESVKDTDL